MIQQICFKEMKNREMIKKLNFDNLLSEFLTWNSINSFIVSKLFF
jgi:hypothetical protein